MLYLNTLLALLSSTTHRLTPSVTMSLASLLPLFRAKLLAALWLPLRRLAAPVYLNTLSPLASTSQMSVPSVADRPGPRRLHRT
jgi:hypothetical protein